jgi:hypothetical protein
VESFKNVWRSGYNYITYRRKTDSWLIQGSQQLLRLIQNLSKKDLLQSQFSHSDVNIYVSTPRSQEVGNVSNLLYIITKQFSPNYFYSRNRHIQFEFRILLQKKIKNVVVELLELLFSIREVSGSNLGPETGYSEVFRGFPQSIQANSGVVPFN